MTQAVHQEGNIGSIFIFTVTRKDETIVDLSTATVLDARFKPSPDVAANVFSLPATSLVTDGTDGKFQYITSSSADLAPAGPCWQRQGYVVVPGLGSFSTFARTFVVKANL